MSHGFSDGYAERGEAVQDGHTDLELGNLTVEVPRHEALAQELHTVHPLDYRASYALQSAIGSDPALTHEAARERALSRLAGICATAGFPMGEPMGRA